MLESATSQEFIARIDASKRAMISKMIAETQFEAPSFASFEIGEVREDDTRTWTYSANT